MPVFTYICTYFCNWSGGHCIKKNALQFFLTLILKVNMSESKNNQTLRLGPLQPTQKEKNPMKFNVKALLSSFISCHCQLYRLDIYSQLQYGAELCRPSDKEVWPPYLDPPFCFNSAWKSQKTTFKDSHTGYTTIFWALSVSIHLHWECEWVFVSMVKHSLILSLHLSWMPLLSPLQIFSTTNSPD